MREIKFRFWDKKANGMATWNEIIILDTDGLLPFLTVLEDKERYVVMQWTGLNDSKGTPIYDGDILSNGQHIHWIVIFEDASFKVKFPEPINTQHFVLDRWMAESREIIGNIFQHPELINS